MYGLACYNQNAEFLGWFYTYQELGYERYTWSKSTLHSKGWKTEKGARNNLTYYQDRLNGAQKSVILKVEVMPEDSAPLKTKQQRWHEKHPGVVEESKKKYNLKRPIWSFRPTPENVEWLEQERWKDEQGKLETDAALLNRKLAKLRELEQQGF